MSLHRNRRAVTRPFLIAASLLAALAFAQSASASVCPGSADPCPWSQVDTFGDVGDGEFRAPYGVEVDAGGNLYVLENDMHRVQKLDSNGGFLAGFGGRGSGDGELDYPSDIAVDPAGGGVFVADTNNHRVVKFDTTGKFVSAWGWGVADGAAAYQVCTSGCRRALNGGGAGEFNYPVGIATDATHVYVVDPNNDRVQKFDLAGAKAGQWTIPGSQEPQGIAVADGKVYVSTRADAIWRFDTSGVPDNTWDSDGVTGSGGTGAGQFSFPEGISVDGTGVYVADSGNNRVQKLDMSGSPTAAWGSAGSGNGQFDQPWGMLATGGSVWVTDAYNHRLQKFSQAGVHQLTVGTPPDAGEFYFPLDVATAASGDVYVAGWSDRAIQRLDPAGKPLARWSTGASAAYSVTPVPGGVYAPGGGDRVRLYDPNGSLLNQFGSSGSALGQFHFPGGSAADADGNVYVADINNNRVQKLSAAGAPLASFGSAGSGDGKLSGPRDVALDSAGNVYVADGYNNRIEKFSPAGDFLAKWGSQGTGDGQFRVPSGVVVDDLGHVFVSDALNNRIQELDANGNFVAKWGTLGAGAGELSYPAGVSIDSNGALWVADYGNHRIARFCCPAVKSAPAPGDGGTPAAPSGGSVPADTTAPRIALRGRAVQRTGVVRRRGLAVRLATSERATATLRAVLSKRTARRLGLRSTSIGRATANLAGPGTSAVRLRLSARARRALLRTPRVRIVVRASAADPAGNRSSASLAITARR